MSTENFCPVTTSLTTPILSISCSFNTYDGISINMKESSRHSIRQLKRRVFKELTNLELFDLSGIKSSFGPEDIICIDTNPSSISIKSSISSKTSKSETVEVIGCNEQIERLRGFIQDNPKSLCNARLFCMGRELKSTSSLKQMRLPCYEDTPIQIQFLLKEDPLQMRKQSKGDQCYLCMTSTMYNCCVL